MPRPRAIIDADRLTTAFSETGLRGISTDQLAARVGLAKPTLYANGHTKLSLYRLALEAEIERLLERLHRAYALSHGRPARQRAAAIAHGVLNHAAARPAGLLLIARASFEAGLDSETGPILGRIESWIAQTLARDLARDRLDPALAPTLARALWGAVLAMALAPAPGPRRLGRERLAEVAGSLIPAPLELPVEPWPAAT